MNVIIVGNTGVKDAVIAGPFTGGNAILFVDKDSVPTSVLDELHRLAPTGILIFGGEARVSASVEAALTAIAPVTRVAGASVYGTAIAASQLLFPPIDIPVDPPVDPPSGMFIPKLQGPVLKHDGNPTVMGGFVQSSGHRTLKNVLINGSVRTSGTGTVTLEDFEIAGSGQSYGVAGWGGRIVLRRGEIHGFEDGIKDNVDTEQVTVHKLRYGSGGHGDCVQLQGAGKSATHKWSYFDAHKDDGVLANAAFIVKNDIGDGSVQSITVEDCYINGGNYTVYLRSGNAGGAPDPSIFRRVLWGGEARYGVLSADAPAPTVWDVT